MDDKILEKFDLLMAKSEFAEAERLLLYWRNEYEQTGEKRELLKILNELIGFYRKQNVKDKCFDMIKQILDVINILEIENDYSSVRPYINIATAYAAFENYKISCDFFLKAKEILDNQSNFSDVNKKIYASLYNNMAVTLMHLSGYEQALKYDEEAIKINEYLSKEDKSRKLDSAITYLNMANIIEKKTGLIKGENEINMYLEKAKNIFDDESIERNAYYSFVCGKCASAFSYYGYFMYYHDLLERKKEIDEGIRNM